MNAGVSPIRTLNIKCRQNIHDFHFSDVEQQGFEKFMYVPIFPLGGNVGLKAEWGWL